MMISVLLQFDSMQQAVEASISLNVGVTLYVFHEGEKWNLGTWDRLNENLVFVSIRPDSQKTDIENFLKE